MSAMTDMNGMYLTEYMSLEAYIGYDVPHEGHYFAKRRAAR